MKYTIKKIININELDEIYSKFIRFSPQKNIFCSKEILEFFFSDLDLYIICKKEEIKSFIYLFKKNHNEITSEPFIYSGIINKPRLSMKNARYNNELFKVNELIVNDIFSTYKDLDINLPLNFYDTRPFLWYNYGQKNKKKFKVIPRYTSIINILSKDKGEIFNELDDVRRRDIKKAIQDKNYQVSDQIDLSLIKKFYLQTMKKNNGVFNKYSFERVFEYIYNQSKINKVIQTTTYYKDLPLYSVLFLNDDISSCYLYGSGDIKVKNRYAGSLALWKAIEKSIDNKLCFIDLEGINSPFRGEYKISFGGNIKNYFNIKFF